MTTDERWRTTAVIDPIRWASYALLAEFDGEGAILEIGPGTRPRVALEGNQFVDRSEIAVEKLRRLGADAQVGSVAALPFDDASFAVVSMFHVLEQVVDDVTALREVMRVLTSRGALVLAVPLHMKYWSWWDEWEDRQRRYDPTALLSLLHENGFVVERYACSSFFPRMKARIGDVARRTIPSVAASWNSLEHDLVPLYPRRYRWETDTEKISPRAAHMTLVCRPQFSGAHDE